MKMKIKELKYEEIRKYCTNFLNKKMSCQGCPFFLNHNEQICAKTLMRLLEKYGDREINEMD